MGEDYGNAEYKKIAQFAKCLTINREASGLHLSNNVAMSCSLTIHVDVPLNVRIENQNN